MHCELFLCKSSTLVLSLFPRKEGQPSASCDSGPTLPRHGGNEISSWMWPMSEKEKRDRPFSRASAENESELLDCDDAIFLT